MIVTGPSRRPDSLGDLLGPELAARLDRLDIHSRRVFAGKLPGERRSKKRGRSVEFAEHREYVQGDDPRFIDWNVLARLDRLFIKMFMEEEDLALHLVVDASASMETPPRPASGEPAGALGVNKKLFTARLACALGYIGLCKQNRVGATVFGAGGAVSLPDSRGRSSVQRLVKFILESCWPEPSPTGARGEGSDGLYAALDRVARTRRGKGVIVVISDFFEPGDDACRRALRRLGVVSAGASGGGGFDVHCLQVLAPSELDPVLLGRSASDALAGDLRLTDAEAPGWAEVTVTAPLIREYQRRLTRYREELRSFCAARSMSYMLVRTDTEMAGLVANSLRRAGLLA